MDYMGIVIAAGLVGITALIIGLLLGLAGIVFKVKADEKELKVRSLLPGVNCGGCGYAGCDALAKAIADGSAPVSGCPVGGDETADRISKVMGVANKAVVHKVAVVKCAGTCDKTEVKYDYYGVGDCRDAAMVPGKGSKKCIYGCMGYGSCVKACPFDAIHVVNGVAVVDEKACKACGRCITACPNHLIELIPFKAGAVVKCNSNDKGRDVKASCSVGCIGCGICAKTCSVGAIKVENNLAYIDQGKCTGCGDCVSKCPTGAIQIG